MSTLGELVDSTGTTVDLDEGDFVAGVVVLTKIVTSGGEVKMAVSSSEGMSWLERIGMLRFAERSESDA